jgi:hypothetical protein
VIGSLQLCQYAPGIALVRHEGSEFVRGHLLQTLVRRLVLRSDPDQRQGARRGTSEWVNSRAMSIREWTSSFFRMCETWVAMVRRDSKSRAAISGLDPSSARAAILISVAVRLSQALRARQC